MYLGSYKGESHTNRGELEKELAHYKFKKHNSKSSMSAKASRVLDQSSCIYYYGIILFRNHYGFFYRSVRSIILYITVYSG
jgi:hypothetical protein